MSTMRQRINFCENYDQSSFDPNYKSMSLEEFSPMVKKYFLKHLIIIFKII